MTILVDGSNVAMSAHFANDTLTGPNGKKTGAIFGVLRSLHTLINRFVPAPVFDARLVVAWDCRRHMSWRRQFYAGYKATRDLATEEEKEQLKEYFEQLPILRASIQALGLHQLTIDNYEADDIAGLYYRDHLSKLPESSLMLVSGDKDWLQLIDKHSSVWQPTKERLIGLHNFTQITGAADPIQYIKMLAIIGDKVDDVPGCRGIGEKLALDYLRGEMKPGARFDKIKAWIKDPDGLKRSLRLVSLRSQLVEPGNVDLLQGRLDQHELARIFAELGFRSLEENFSTFTETFARVNVT